MPTLTPVPRRPDAVKPAALRVAISSPVTSACTRSPADRSKVPPCTVTAARAAATPPGCATTMTLIPSAVTASPAACAAPTAAAAPRARPAEATAWKDEEPNPATDETRVGPASGALTGAALDAGDWERPPPGAATCRSAPPAAASRATAPTPTATTARASETVSGSRFCEALTTPMAAREAGATGATQGTLARYRLG